MENNRHSFFAALLAPVLAPLAARFLPIKQPEIGTFINEQINPTWNGGLDQINSITLQYMSDAGLPDMIFCSSPVFEYLNAKWALRNDPDVRWSPGDKYYRKPGEGWKRMDGGLRYPATPARLPV
jgi:hypothetical protein